MSATYSFLDISCNMVGPGIIAQLGNGAAVAEEGITIVSGGDKNTMSIGADGLGLHSLHADKSGQLTVRLLKNSPMNSVLATAYAIQTSNASLHGGNTIVVNDKNRGDVITATQVAFKKAPDVTYAKDADTIEWVFDAVRIERILGS